MRKGVAPLIGLVLLVVVAVVYRLATADAGGSYEPDPGQES